MKSVLNIDVFCYSSLAVTPMVDNAYHEGVDGMSLSGLVMRRGRSHFFGIAWLFEVRWFWE